MSRSLTVPTWVLAADIGPRGAGAVLLLVVLWSFADWAHGEGDDDVSAAFVWPSIDALAALLGASRRTVEDRLAQLAKAGLIERFAAQDGRRGWLLAWVPTTAERGRDHGRPWTTAERGSTAERGERPRPSVDETTAERGSGPRPSVVIPLKDHVMGPNTDQEESARPEATTAERGPRPSVDEDERTKIARLIARHHVSGSTWAFVDSWTSALEQTRVELGLDARKVEAVLDVWHQQHARSRGDGTLVQALASKALPELRALWWGSSRRWLLTTLSAVGRPLAVVASSASLDVDPCGLEGVDA